MTAKIHDLEIEIYHYTVDEQGRRYCICKIPSIPNLVPVLISLIDIY